MIGSCHCGGNADACSEGERHTGDKARASTSASWGVFRCSTCRAWTSAPAGDVCAECRHKANRAYFESDEARELVRRVLG